MWPADRKGLSRWAAVKSLRPFDPRRLAALKQRAAARRAIAP